MTPTLAFSCEYCKLSKNIWECLLLIVVIYCIENWIKLFRNQIGLLFLLKHKITLFYLLSFVFICFITRCHSLSLVIFCYSLSSVVTCCTTRCHSLYHSLSFVVIRCTIRSHSLLFVVPFVVIRCHSMYHSSIFL